MVDGIMPDDVDGDVIAEADADAEVDPCEDVAADNLLA
jgi:hypothetical protein